MKTNRILATLVVILLTVSVVAAQRRGPGRQGKPQGAQAVKALNLSAEQRQQIRPVMEERRKALEGVRNDTSLTRAQTAEKIQEINRSYDSRMEQHLTADQKSKFDQLKAERASRQGKRPRSRPRRDF